MLIRNALAAASIAFSLGAIAPPTVLAAVRDEHSHEDIDWSKFVSVTKATTTSGNNCATQHLTSHDWKCNQATYHECAVVVKTIAGSSNVCTTYKLDVCDETWITQEVQGPPHVLHVNYDHVSASVPC